jgi:hypothetical protein
MWASIPLSNKIYNSYDEEWDFYDPSCDILTLTRTPAADNDPTEEHVNVARLNRVKPNLLCIQDDAKIMLEQMITEAIAYCIPLFCEDDPLGTATRRFGFLFPTPPVAHHVVKKNDQVQWYYHLRYKDVKIPMDKATQIEQTLYCLQKDHPEQLRFLLNIYKEPQGLMGRNTVII